MQYEAEPPVAGLAAVDGQGLGVEFAAGVNLGLQRPLDGLGLPLPAVAVPAGGDAQRPLDGLGLPLPAVAVPAGGDAAVGGDEEIEGEGDDDGDGDGEPAREIGIGNAGGNDSELARLRTELAVLRAGQQLGNKRGRGRGRRPAL